jgi:hypothetical protein
MKIENVFNFFFHILNEYFMHFIYLFSYFSQLSGLSLTFTRIHALCVCGGGQKMHKLCNTEIKIQPGSVSTDDDHLNFIGGEWYDSDAMAGHSFLSPILL